jgi:hypothetical protein
VVKGGLEVEEEREQKESMKWFELALVSDVELEFVQLETRFIRGAGANI